VPQPPGQRLGGGRARQARGRLGAAAGRVCLRAVPQPASPAVGHSMARGGGEAGMTLKGLLPLVQPGVERGGGCECGGGGACGGAGGLDRVRHLAAETPAPHALDPADDPHLSGFRQLLEREVDRRTALGLIGTGLMAGLGLFQSACNPLASAESRERAVLDWQEYFQGNFRLMTDKEKSDTVHRLERLHELRTGQRVDVSATGARPGVLYGYAFNISKCRGYMDCIRGCVKENNQDRRTGIQYIRIHEHKKGQMDFGHAEDDFFHEVPAAGHFYIGTQCFHCQNPPCVDVCPVKATWMEPDGIVVVDYN